MHVLSFPSRSLSAFLLVALTLGCGGAKKEEAATAEAPGATAKEEPATSTLTLGAYTTPREAYGTAIIPAFTKHWADSSKKTLQARESYLGSGAQARAIIGGFEADVAALSL